MIPTSKIKVFEWACAAWDNTGATEAVTVPKKSLQEILDRIVDLQGTQMALDERVKVTIETMPPDWKDEVKVNLERDEAWNLILELVPVYESSGQNDPEVLQKIRKCLQQRAATLQPSQLEGNVEIKASEIGKKNFLKGMI